MRLYLSGLTAVGMRDTAPLPLKITDQGKDMFEQVRDLMVGFLLQGKAK